VWPERSLLEGSGEHIPRDRLMPWGARSCIQVHDGASDGPVELVVERITLDGSHP
jgi:hypothetical protein